MGVAARCGAGNKSRSWVRHRRLNVESLALVVGGHSLSWPSRSSARRDWLNLFGVVYAMAMPFVAWATVYASPVAAALVRSIWVGQFRKHRKMFGVSSPEFGF